MDESLTGASLTVILQPFSRPHEQDVIAGVRLARERGLTVSVRAGGHSWIGWSVRDDALLIDLGGMREISLDKDTSIVRVSPAVTGGELNSLLAEHGLMFRGGHCPTVGLGGFLLQGGMGWACESIVAIDVVTADGELVPADESQRAGSKRRHDSGCAAALRAAAQ